MYLDYVRLANSFLFNRIRTVVVNNVWSEPLELKLGVPQGSLLGPLLFSVYMWNFWEVITYCKVHHYADDTHIWHSFMESQVSEVWGAINNDLGKLCKVCQAHNLSFNRNKTAIMLFGRDFRFSTHVNTFCKSCYFGLPHRGS